ncbi:MAG: CPBP family intramembrane metalloprotease [Opitutaceae bacterium]|nr:CPBP family intramembrane metalloprotease [Opitutaceae bacterium]
MPQNILISAEALFLLLGLAYWIRCLFTSKETPIWKAQNRLTRWKIPLSDFFLFLFVLLVFVFVGSQLVIFGLAKWTTEIKGNLLKETVVIGYATHLSCLIGWFAFSLMKPSIRLTQKISWAAAFKKGLLSLIIVLPPLLIIAATWEFLLKNFGISTAPQELIGILRSGENVPYLIAIVFLAVIIAPINEELLFRGGVFRFLYQRVPSWAAILISSSLFAILHGNWLSFLPLVLLGSLLCLLTQKSGSLKPAIFLHALFNLHSIIFIFSGIDI